jgi:hypothetical protein
VVALDFYGKKYRVLDFLDGVAFAIGKRVESVEPNQPLKKIKIKVRDG